MKTLFVFKIDHSIDLITNSSSELFVLHGKTKEVVEEMIKTVYPNYRNEYDEIKSLRELNNDDINSHLYYKCSTDFWPCKKSDYPILNGFKFDELYEAKSDEPAWNGHLQYQLKNNNPNKKDKWNTFFVTDENRDKVLNALDPNNNTFFMYSIDENPNWDYQELLMEVGERFHLG